MSDPVAVLLTTYNRTDLALRTIKGIVDYFEYPNYFFLIADDGSNEGHLGQLRQACGDRFIDAYNSNRKGVGHGMNWGLRRARELGAEICVIAEDDWELRSVLNVQPFVNLLNNHADIGMIRLGYLSYGIKGEIVSREGKLWLKMQPYMPFQYTYAGHFSIRHLRFHDEIGFFHEGLAPGATELGFCQKVNNKPNAPAIVWCMDYGWLGPAYHIGSVSLADCKPER